MGEAICTYLFGLLRSLTRKLTQRPRNDRDSNLLQIKVLAGKLKLTKKSLGFDVAQPDFNIDDLLHIYNSSHAMTVGHYKIGVSLYSTVRVP